MSLTRDNPVAIEVVGNEAPRIAPQIDELVKRIRDVDDGNAGWARRQLDFIRARFGKRKRKRVPWEGASNVNVPLIDGIVRRWRPGITSLVLDANPVAFFVAREETDLDPARSVEPFFTWLFIDEMKTPPEVFRLVDLIAVRGHAYAREGWCYKTEREVRIAQIADLFPEGVGRYIENQRSQLITAAQQGQAPPDALNISDEVLVARRFVEEYELSLDDPDEQPMLIEAARRVLQGADKVKLIYERVEEDRPDWKAIDPINTIVPRNGDPETADFFVVLHEVGENELRMRARDGEFPEDTVAALIRKLREKETDAGTRTNKSGGAGAGMVRQQIRRFQDRRSGQTSIDVGKHRERRVVLWETFCHIDLNGDGIAERCVLWHAPEFNITLKATDYTMPFSEWPITLYKFEPQAESPSDSRGIPELLSELQKLVNAFHNARVDAAQIVLAPVLQRRASSADYAQRVQWRPGAMIPVQQVGDIAPIQHDLRILTGLLVEEQQNQRVAETFIGTFDATINQLNQPTERRTAAEVNAITSLAQNVFGLDARIFQTSMARSFRKIWKLWREYGPKEVFFRVTGEQQPRLARKEELDKEYDITPAGTPTSTNKSFLLANMERILSIVINDQSGRFDIGALLEAYFKLIDYNLAKSIIRDPEQTNAAQLVQQAAAALTDQDQGALFQV